MVLTHTGCPLADLARGRYYATPLAGEAWPDVRNARNRHNLFMFPPESVAHMAHSFSQVQACARRYALEAFAALRDAAAPVLNDTIVHERTNTACALRYHNHLLPAMLMLGRSIGPDEVAHEQCTLTLCSIQDGRELACMSWEHGLIFSARIAKQRVVLKATLATHEWPRVEGLSSGNIVAFSPMPFAEDTSVCISEFYELLKHGVCIEGCDIFVDVRQPKKPGARSLPCVLCPVVHWPVLLLLVEDGWTTPGRHPLRLRPSSEVFHEHSERFTVLTCLAGCTRASVAGALAAVALMEKVDENLLWEAVQRYLAFGNAASLCLSTDGLQVLGIWGAHADSSLTFFASVAELWYSLFVPGEDEVCVQLIAAHEEHGLCNVRQLPSGRYAARYWEFLPPSVLRELCDEAARLCADNQSLTLDDAADELQKEVFGNRREVLCDVRDETAMLLAEAPTVGSRRFRSQTFFDFAQCSATFAPAGDLLLRSPKRESTGRALPLSQWGLVLERDAVFLRNGCYAVSAVDPRSPQSSVLFEMDFATMSRAMLQEGAELWVLVNSTVYSRILKEAHAQGAKIMLPVSQELHARLKQDPQGSRLLRVFYVLGGSSNVEPIEGNSIRIIVVVASKSCAQGRKATADEHADASSPVNGSIGAGNTKMLTICLPLYGEDGSPIVTYHRDPALPFYRYLKEDISSRSRGSAAT